MRALVLALVLVLIPAAARCGEFEDELLTRINAWRQEHGLDALRRDARLDALALEQARAMRAAKRLSHDGFDERFDRAGSNHCVENAGLLWPEPAAKRQFEGWRDSPGHNENLLDPEIRRAGLAMDGGYTAFFSCR
jgi:uncharacterized protein YkwD